MTGDDLDGTEAPPCIIARIRSPWGSPFFAPRNQLVGGILVGLAVTGGFFGLRSLLTDQPPHPDEWLTVQAQELLGDAVLTSPVGGWAAACLWKDRDLRDITEVVEGPEDAVRFRVFESGRKPDGLQLSILTYEDAQPGDGSFDEVSGRGYFCYVPSKDGD